MKTIDKLSWKFSRIAPIELSDKLELGQDVEIKITAGVVQELTSDNQDGTVNVCYMIKPITTDIQYND